MPSHAAPQRNPGARESKYSREAAHTVFRSEAFRPAQWTKGSGSCLFWFRGEPLQDNPSRSIVDVSFSRLPEPKPSVPTLCPRAEGELLGRVVRWKTRTSEFLNKLDTTYEREYLA